MDNYLPLMLVTQRQSIDYQAYLVFLEACMQGGITSIQLREKGQLQPWQCRYAEQVRILAARYRVSFFINDHLDLALDLDADGLHLGQDDRDPSYARERLGDKKYLGLSLETEAQVIKSRDLPLTYVAASAVFPTKNKQDVRTFWGLEGLATMCKQAKHPVLAIGGITLEHVPDLIQAGAKGIAVIGALHEASDPIKMADLLRQACVEV